MIYRTIPVLPPRQPPVSIKSLQSQLLNLESATNLSLSKLQSLLNNNQSWKIQTLLRFQRTINHLTSDFQQTIEQSFQQLMDVKNKIHLIEAELEGSFDVQNVKMEIERIRQILRDSKCVESIESMQMPFEKEFEVVQVSGRVKERSHKKSIGQDTFYKTSVGSCNGATLYQQQYYQNIIKSLSSQYQTLSQEYNRLVYRIMNNQERGLIKQIINQDKLRSSQIEFIKQKEDQRYGNLMKVLKSRKESLTQMSGIIIQSQKRGKENFVDQDKQIRFSSETSTEERKLK